MKNTSQNENCIDTIKYLKGQHLKYVSQAKAGRDTALSGVFFLTVGVGSLLAKSAGIVTASHVGIILLGIFTISAVSAIGLGLVLLTTGLIVNSVFNNKASAFLDRNKSFLNLSN